MDDFQKEFLMELFLDNDSVNTVNRLSVAVADVINENKDVLNNFNGAIADEFGNDCDIESRHAIMSAPRRYKNYYEQQVPHFTNEDYEATFRMRRSTVQALINFLNDFVPPGIIPLDKKIHVFLMFIMSDLSYNDVGALFGLHKSSVSHIFQEIGFYLADNRMNYIRWPSLDDQHMTRIKVNSRYKIPNCVGFIDVCRLKLGLNRKKSDMILLQAICDESLMFIDVFIGEIGKSKKSKVFKDSGLANKLQNMIDIDNHILGDSEYKLHMNLVTPFSNEELLTSEEMKFNEIHWKARSHIGHAFELLKEKFSKLNHIEIFKPELVHILIYSACVLHNFILIHEGCPLVKEETVVCDDGVTMNTDVVLTPVEKRQFLCNYINYIDSDNETVASR